MIGASGGIGSALCDTLGACGAFALVLGLHRGATPVLDLRSEASICACAEHAARLGPLRLVVVASGILHGEGLQPEKSWRDLDAARLADAFAINAVGPALVMKHFLPLLPASGKSVFAVLSARVGSITDNRLGGWWGYRASKAALNQFVRNAAIELKRTRPEAACVALHPGTVATRLSAPFARAGLQVQSPATAAGRLLGVIERLGPEDSGGFFDQNGTPIPW